MAPCSPPIMTNTVEIGEDIYSLPETVLTHSGSNEYYIDIMAEEDGDVFIADLLDAESPTNGNLRILYYKDTIIESCLVDTSSPFPSSIRSIEYTCPISYNDFYGYIFSWRTSFYSIDLDSTIGHLGFFNIITSNLDTIFNFPDTTIHDILTDQLGRIWILQNGSYIRHTTDTNAIVFENRISKLEFGFKEVFPNPFNEKININFEIIENAFYTLSLSNLSGQRIKIFFKNYRYRGNYNIEFEAKNLSTGIYLLKLENLKGEYKTKKIILLK